MRKTKREKIWRVVSFERGDLGQEVIKGFLVEDPCVKVRAHFPKGSEKKKKAP